MFQGRQDHLQTKTKEIQKELSKVNKVIIINKRIINKTYQILEIKDKKKKRIINYTKVGKEKKFKKLDLNNVDPKSIKGTMIKEWIKELKEMPEIYVKTLCSETKDMEGKTFKYVKDKVDEHLTKKYLNVSYSKRDKDKILQAKFIFTDFPILLAVFLILD